MYNIKLNSILLIFIILFSITLVSSLPDDLGNRIDFEYETATNYSTVNVNNSEYWDGHAWSDTRWLDIDGGNANQDIDIGDYAFDAGDGDFDNDGDNTIVTIHSGDTNLNASLIFEEVGLSRWRLLFEGLNNHFYLWNDFHNAPTIETNLVTNEITLHNNTHVHGDLLPTDSLTYDIGSGAKRWRTGYFQNISADDIKVVGNITASGYLLGDGSYLTGVNTTNLSYVPYTGATSNVDLGSYNLTAEDLEVGGKLEVDDGIKSTNNIEIFGSYFLKWLDNGGANTYAYIIANIAEFKLAAVSEVPMNFYYGNLGSHLGASMDGTTGNWTFANNVTADTYFGNGSQLTNLPNPFDQVLNTTSGVQFNTITEDITSAGSINQIQVDMSLDLTDNDYESTYRGLYSDWDYTLGAGKRSYSTLSWLELDWDLTDNGAVAFNLIPKVLKVDVDGANNYNKIFDMDITSDGSGANSLNGAFYFSITESNPTGNVISARTASIISNTSNSESAIGYQGYAQNSDESGNGYSIALNPVIALSDTTKTNYWFKPLMIGTSNSKDRSIVIYTGGVGHILASQGGVAITSTAYDELTSNPADHVSSWNTTIADGFLYVEEDVEIDGTLYADGDINQTGNFTGNQIYGSIYNHEDNMTIISFATQDIYVNVTNMTIGSAGLNGFTYIGDNDGVGLITQIAGVYGASWGISFSGQTGSIHGASIGINGVKYPDCYSQRKLGSADTGYFGKPCQVRLEVGEIVTLLMADEDVTLNDVSIKTGSLNLVRIGN